MSKSGVVLVTGVSSGIGRTTAELFARQDCRVFGIVRNVASAKPIAGVELVEMDLRDDAWVQRGVQAVVAATGRIGVVVNSVLA
jgi:NAD(P)-dependent dehydrogenase (short-subunit alcohol dehydrogenase family)